MKILFITSMYFPDEPGGAEVIARRIAEYLHSSSIDVSVICFDARESTSSEEVNGVKVYRLYIKELSENLTTRSANRIPLGKAGLLKLLLNPLIWNNLKKEFLKILPVIEKSDIIHYANNLGGIPQRKLMRCISDINQHSLKVLTFHDYFFLGRRSVYPNKKIPFVAAYKQKMLRKYINWFITPSEFVKQVVSRDLQIPPARIKRIYNSTHPVDCTSPAAITYPIRLIYAGAIELNKGMDSLVQTFIKLIVDYPGKVSLTIIGSGDYYSEVEKMLILAPSGSYRLLQWQPFEQMVKILQQSHIFVLPSRFNETFGMGLIDAYRSGCLPMGSERGAIPEVLKGEKKLLFNSDEDLFIKLKHFIDNPSDIIKMRESLEAHMKQFSSEESLREYLEFYKVISTSVFA